MKAKGIIALLIGVAVLAIAIGVFIDPNQPANFRSQELETGLSSKGTDPPIPDGFSVARWVSPHASQSTLIPPSVEGFLSTTNKLERLTQIREKFRLLAGGEPTEALRAAKQIAGENERETALLMLATEWTKGELRPAQQRARSVASYGLEAGLGMELVGSPDLAVLWANELTDGPGRVALLQQTATTMTDSDPGAALALSEQVPQSDRQGFNEAVFTDWAGKDTEAALQWAGRIPDSTEQNVAIQAIRSVAPVGIGAALRMQDGYPVINQLLPGTPAEISGQIRPGDRILALAQGDNAFVAVQDIPLQDVAQMVRGAPGTVLHLQLQAADAAPGSQPRIVSITRDQIKFKR